MEPLAIISSINLAAKVLPPAWEQLTAQKATPESAATNRTQFTSALRRVELRPDLQMDRNGWSQNLLAELHSLPEVSALIAREGSDELSWRISEGGQLQALKAGQIIEEVALSSASLEATQQIYATAQVQTPPLFSTQGTANCLQLAPTEAGQPASLAWLAA